MKSLRHSHGRTAGNARWKVTSGILFSTAVYDSTRHRHRPFSVVLGVVTKWRGWPVINFKLGHYQRAVEFDIGTSRAKVWRSVVGARRTSTRMCENPNKEPMNLMKVGIDGSRASAVPPGRKC